MCWKVLPDLPQRLQAHLNTTLSHCLPSPQDVVPQALLDQYLSMTDPSRAQTVDTEIAKHCAYSLPGVALTLGRQNWHCLRETYETLASDMQVGVVLRGGDHALWVGWQNPENRFRAFSINLLSP